ncbi:alpha/beta hydrolase fold domain-containing protein [Streptomyces sp. NPDC046977]|uniref:alpha/beta hydrolase n=1 Tax=Streptomyces sp. NPDC046977 TaxID=3154703 RepID=UPI003403B926
MSFRKCSPDSPATPDSSPSSAPSFAGMRVDGLDEELIAAQQQVNAMLAQMPQPDITTPEGLEMLRAMTTPPQAAPVLVPQDITIQAPTGSMRLHVFTPEQPARAVILRIHGGGWAAGTPEDDEAYNDHLARTCQVAVVSPEYQLVPEATIMDQIEDCLAAASWVAAEAASRFGTDKLLIGGISAGGHLAAAVALRLRDQEDPAFAMLKGLLLDCGAYDLSFTPSARRADDNTPVLPRSSLDGLAALGLPGLDDAERRHPSLSPLYADLHGMPPALFTVGDLDPLRDDSVFLASLWQLAGNNADLDVWPHAAHAFTNMGAPIAGIALTRTTDWINAAL